MKRDGLTRVRAIVKKMPDVEEGLTFGWPAFKVKGVLFAWFPQKKEVEPNTLAARMSVLERDFRIKAEPELFYVTPHYVGYTSILARPDKMSDKALQELLESSYEYLVAEAKRKKAVRRKAKH